MDVRMRALLAANGHVCTTGQLRAIDVDEVLVARMVRSGTVVRLRRGLHAEGSVWHAATPERRLALCTRAVLLERPGAAASHTSATVIHGLPLWGVRVPVVDLACATPRRRVRPGLRLHPWPDAVGATTVDGVPVVPLPVAIAQVAAERGSVPGLVCLDRALHERSATTGAVAEAGDLLGLGLRARRRLDEVIERADPECESVGETRTRALLTDLGLEVRTQVAVRDGDGFIGRVDFLVGERVVVEFDGMVKYGGVDGRRALQTEKAREDRLRAAGYVVVRLVWADLENPERVLDLLRRAMTQVV